jgi:hypothetical protein
VLLAFMRRISQVHKSPSSRKLVVHDFVPRTDECVVVVIVVSKYFESSPSFMSRRVCLFRRRVSVWRTPSSSVHTQYARPAIEHKTCVSRASVPPPGLLPWSEGAGGRYGGTLV